MTSFKYSKIVCACAVVLIWLSLFLLCFGSHLQKKKKKNTFLQSLKIRDIFFQKVLFSKVNSIQIIAMLSQN